MVKTIYNRYLRNNFFFFVGVFCIVTCSAADHCIIISYVVLFTKLLEIVGLFFGMLWICYLAHALGELANYVNIITAIVDNVRA